MYLYSLRILLLRCCTTSVSIFELELTVHWHIICYGTLLTLGACARVTVVVLCVCVSVCLSVTKLAATYLVCKSKLRCYTIPHGVPNACIVWIPLKTLCSPVLASFADGKLLDFSLSGTYRSIYTKGHVPVLYTVCPAHGRGLVKARPTEHD